ncbi:MAG: tRNA (N6-threonylcarbamoyladenosine(37)-N6)-methyltransferase TrmO [Clostridiales bacterium]|nr:tRNA (N6-threonylcarbamoyladenosine(37)-N6)-methyltransferase TrmO [Clostridiales bacterium]
MNQLKQIAHIESPFPEKFGIPRQSGVVPGLESQIIFEPDYRNPDALRGLEDFTHLWLIWNFSEVRREGWSPTVRPPRLGGNARKGVFATLSHYRPNPIGFSCVALMRFATATQEGPVRHVAGADLMDGTPIYDIKPYLPYADCRPEAKGGFADGAPAPSLRVEIPQHLIQSIPEHELETLRQVLALDPRPAYQKNPDRVYGMAFAGYDVKFSVTGSTVQVCEIKQTAHQPPV